MAFPVAESDKDNSLGVRECNERNPRCMTNRLPSLNGTNINIFAVLFQRVQIYKPKIEL